MVPVDLPKGKLFIDGTWRDAASGETTAVHDPATDAVVAEVAAATEEDAKAAVDAAKDAFADPSWRDLDPSKRGRLLYELAQAVRDEFDPLATLESLNVGKPIREARGDIAYVYKTLEYFAGLADKIQGDTIPVPGRRLNYTLRQPLGVTVHIAPWNYPLVLACRGMAAALAAGNTVVLKPAGLTPLTALKFAELCDRVGVPPGVVNVVPGPGSRVGHVLVAHPDVASVTFTGSVETGRQILHAAADNVTATTLELGGKNPNIVFPDADMDKALRGVAFGIYQNAGQMCWSGSRLLVEAAIHRSFVDRLAKRAATLRLGPGLEDGTQMGPLVSRDQEESVLRYVRLGEEEGARLLAGGRKVEEGSLAKGHFVAPTIFDEVAPDMTIAQEEIFGPVLAVTPFDDVDDLVAKANATRFGLFAGVWTQNLRLAHDVAARLEAGMVSVNEYPVTFPQTPFGGWKLSGLGHEQGIEAVRSYTRLKNVNVNLG
jgi:acyl-CoA reductase-like NAD-dependent aldehyde dehydrogenase